MLRPPRLAILPVLLLAVALPEARAAHIRGKVVRVGFSGSGRDLSTQGMDLYRPGYWTPVLIELNNDDGDLFEGLLQARQVDRDGDQIISTLPVALRGMKEVLIYVPASPQQLRQPFVLRMAGPDGAPVPMFDDANQPTTEWRPASEPRAVDVSSQSSPQILLNISRGAIPHLGQLAADPMLVRELVVARGSPGSLPDSSPGLHMVDIVLWDDADPSQFRDVSQQQALLEWVRRGGMLVFGVSRNWELVSKSVWGRLLPAPLKPPATSRNTPQDGRPGALDELSRALMSMATDFDTPVSFCPIKRSELAPDAIALLPGAKRPFENETPAGEAPADSPDDLIFVSARPCGRGRIVLVAAEIQDLLARASVRTHGESFLRLILGIRREIGQTDRPTGAMSAQDAFNPVEETTGFRVTSGLYFLVAFLFVVLYILVATIGSWSVLQRRQRVHFAWTVFAAIAVIASGASLFAVQIIRGIGNRVQQLIVVDGYAGEQQATGSCYFGLKTASHVSLDLAVPRDYLNARETADNPGGLMPLPASAQDFSLSQYSAGGRYQAGGPVGQLWEVPLRATLKQFQGGWDGQLPGRVNASLRHRPDSRLFTLDSWIENRLDTDLTECYLLVATRNVEGEFTEGAQITSRARFMQVYPIGTLPRGKRLVWREYLIRQIEEELKSQNKDPAAELTADERRNPAWTPKLLLTQWHEQWLSVGYKVQTDPYGTSAAQPKTGGESLTAALMILTTYAEVNRDTGRSYFVNQVERWRGFELDRSDALTTRTALLTGFAQNHAGPVRLAFRQAGGTAADWEPIEPSQATTMYRFTIPIASQ